MAHQRDVFLLGAVTLVFLIIVIIVVWVLIMANTGRSLYAGCSNDAECQNGLVCSHNVCLQPAGMTCGDDRQCAIGTQCVGRVCTPDSQVALGAGGCGMGMVLEGGICRGVVGYPCQHSGQCASWTGGCRGGVCVANERRLNSTCGDGQQCNQGLVCRDGLCKIDDFSFVPCGDDNQCASGNCNGGQCI